MKEVCDFIVAALPWVAIGLFLAFTCEMTHAKYEGRTVSKCFRLLSWCPVVCFFVIAVINMYNGSKSSGTTWLVLGICNATANFSSLMTNETPAEGNPS